MSELVEAVIDAIHEAKYQDKATKETVAHAAIKATLEHLQDYAGSEMISKGYMAMQHGIGPFVAVEVLRAMLSQAIKEMEAVSERTAQADVASAAPESAKSAGEVTDKHLPINSKTYVLRPYCISPGEHCGGFGEKHCHGCTRLMESAEDTRRKIAKAFSDAGEARAEIGAILAAEHLPIINDVGGM